MSALPFNLAMEFLPPPVMQIFRDFVYILQIQFSLEISFLTTPQAPDENLSAEQIQIFFVTILQSQLQPINTSLRAKYLISKAISLTTVFSTHLQQGHMFVLQAQMPKHIPEQELLLQPFRNSLSTIPLQPEELL